MSVATASSARVIGSVAKVAKTTGSVSLFCLRLPLYVLSFILLAIVAISVYYLASLYFAYQDFSSNSQQSTDFLPLFSQGWLAEREAETPNDHSARHSTKSVFAMSSMDASNSTEPNLQAEEKADSQAIIVDEPVSTSVFAPHDPEVMTRNRFANFGLRPEVMLADNNTATAQSTVPVQSTAPAQNTAPEPDTVAALLAATADAITDTAVATDTAAATTAHSHFPFTAVNSFNWLTASDSTEAPHRLSVTERMEANNQAVDSRLDDILAQRELECLAQTQAQAQAMVQALTAAAFATVDKVDAVDGTTAQAIAANAATAEVATTAITTETAPAKDAAVTTTAATAITTEPQAQATLSTACVSMTKHSDCISS